MDLRERGRERVSQSLLWAGLGLADLIIIVFGLEGSKMSVVSGVISRQVLPACGSLCFFCPAMRARSRQPVKRYKKIIADIFPRFQVFLLLL